MISPAIAAQLRGRGLDVDAVKRDRPELQGLPDVDIVRRMTRERRAIVTSDVADFQPIHDRTLARGCEHSGMVFTDDAVLPRTRASIPLWVDALDAFLAEHRAQGALRNRVHHPA